MLIPMRRAIATLVLTALTLGTACDLFADALHPPSTAQRSTPPLSAIAARMNHAAILRGAFTQEKQFSIMTRPLISQGQFVLDRQQGIWWHTETPIVNDMVLSAKGILQKNAAGQRQQMESSKQPALKMMTDIIRQLVAGDWEQLARHFEIAVTDSDTQWQATMTPKAGSLFSGYAKEINIKGSDFVNFISIRENSGDETRISFSQLSPDTQLQRQENEAFSW